MESFLYLTLSSLLIVVKQTYNKTQQLSKIVRP